MVYHVVTFPIVEFDMGLNPNDRWKRNSRAFGFLHAFYIYFIFQLTFLRDEISFGASIIHHWKIKAFLLRHIDLFFKLKYCNEKKEWTGVHLIFCSGLPCAFYSKSRTRQFSASFSGPRWQMRKKGTFWVPNFNLLRPPNCKFTWLLSVKSL